MLKTRAKILSNQLYAENTFKMILQFAVLPEILPGQFIMISTANTEGMILKRPISIHSFDIKEKSLTIIYDLAGEGTKSISKMQSNSFVEILLPLGNSFELQKYNNIAVVGGGLGVIPLCSVMQFYNDKKFSAYLGFRNKNKIICTEVYDKMAQSTKITTDDGSVGTKDYITNVLKKDLVEKKFDAIIACGPKPMLSSLKKVVGDIPTFVSMEERMGCGFGACLVCTCKTIKGNKRVCTDGPIFDINEVIL